jgi:hypothetical protein
VWKIDGFRIFWGLGVEFVLRLCDDSEIRCGESAAKVAGSSRALRNGFGAERLGIECLT